MKNTTVAEFYELWLVIRELQKRIDQLEKRIPNDLPTIRDNEVHQHP